MQSGALPQSLEGLETGMQALTPLTEGSVPHQRAQSYGDVLLSEGSGGSGGAMRAVSQHRFLSQLQQQGLQHRLDEAIRGMQAALQ